MFSILLPLVLFFSFPFLLFIAWFITPWIHKLVCILVGDYKAIEYDMQCMDNRPILRRFWEDVIVGQTPKDKDTKE